MKRFFILIVLCAWVFVSGCKKNDPPIPVTEESPVFYCKCNLDASSYAFEAGVNSYYMFTSFHIDSLRTQYIFSGELKPVGTQAAKSISFDIKDVVFNPLSGSHIDSIRPGAYKYWTDSTSKDKYAIVKFDGGTVSNTQAIGIKWDFGDGSSSNTTNNPSHIYDSAGVYNVCATTYYKDGCNDAICYPINVMADELCSADIYCSFSGDTVLFQAIADANTYSFLWDFGDGETGSGKSISHYYATKSVYTVSLKTMNFSKCQASRYIRLKHPTLATGCTSNFKYEKSIHDIATKKSIITVNWKNEQGMVFTTANLIQPPDAYFDIISIDDYFSNEKNQKTKRIRARFSCNLSNGVKTISIKNGDAVFAVAYE